MLLEFGKFGFRRVHHNLTYNVSPSWRGEEGTSTLKVDIDHFGVLVDQFHTGRPILKVKIQKFESGRICLSIASFLAIKLCSRNRAGLV